MLNQCQEKSHHMRNTEAKFSPDLQKKILGKIRYKSSQVIPKNWIRINVELNVSHILFLVNTMNLHVTSYAHKEFQAVSNAGLYKYQQLAMPFYTETE